VLKRLKLLILFLFASLSFSVYADGKQFIKQWSNWGQNIHNTHHNPNSGVTKDNVGNIVELCKIDYTQGSTSPNPKIYSTSSKPIMINDVVYWTAMSGKVGAHKISRKNNGEVTGCHSLWVQDVSDLLGIADTGGEPSARSSPAYYTRSNGKGALLYTAVDSAFALPFPLWLSTPPVAFALDAETGNPIWQTPVPLAGPGTTDPDAFFPSTTASPRIYEGMAYIGLASLNNALNGPPFYFPLTFRGHMIALDLGENGNVPHVKWKQFTVPPRPASYPVGTWFSGGGVWASAPSIIPDLGLVIFGSGQLYQYPDFVTQCMQQPEPVTTADFSTNLKGETGKGASECLTEAQQYLNDQLGITHPIATNSIIALNMNNGSYAWHVPTAGIDSWQVACGLSGEIPCNVPVPGPDWDISGSSPIVVKSIKINGTKYDSLVVGHNKGGSIFWIDPKTGNLLRKADVCVGSALGGIHWGLGYDPRSRTLLASCSGGQIAPTFGPPVHFYSKLANGLEVCKTGYLNGINVETGQLKWQTVPYEGEIKKIGQDPECTSAKFALDERFKYGLNFDVTLKNTEFPGVKVNIIQQNGAIPLSGQDKARSNGVPANSKGIVYWPVYYGVVYALDIKNGSYLNQLHCDQGAMYSAGPSVAGGVISFGCGYGFAGGQPDVGKSIMIYGLPKYKPED
jgi:outer membrane protein assembly factor BamB